jgi:DNA mismatch repair protein MutS
MSDTPLMQQYREIKARHRDAILLFRMGDFYEMFYEDAEIGSRALGLTLTSRNNGGAAAVPLAGVPVKAVSEYVRRLIRQGFRVAICDQVEDPKVAHGVVRRAVVETVTPGAVFADELLDAVRNNYLCAVALGAAAGEAERGHGTANGLALGIAAADLSTGELRMTTVPAPDAPAVFARLAPRELLVARGAVLPAAVRLDGVLLTERDGWEFDAQLGREDLARQFGVASLEGFGIGEADAAAVGAAGALLRYLRELQPGGVPHLARPLVDRPDGTMPLDEMTRRNLELVESLRGGDGEGTLLDVLDRTLTPMGARLLRQWVLAPLTERARIEDRLARVAALAADPQARAALRTALDGVRDLERLAGKTAAGRATPRELRALGDSVARLPAVAEATARVAGSGQAFAAFQATWDPCADIGDPIRRALVERPPSAIGEEPAIATGVDTALDELRGLRDGGKDKIAEVQAAERARTGIASLKVGYNRVFGYYIEVTNAHRGSIPADYQRRQTLTGAERYVTPALKEYEERVLTAAERIETRERELFEALRADTGRLAPRVQSTARLVAELDVLATLADVAERERYVRPTITDGYALEITAGRHPVVERMMPREQFIPNDARLTDAARVIILTGPNMAGKSTILRQVGLIVVLAQMGSFVPAASATIGVVDRLFTRVGASDNLVRGQSTFMVEMAETSAILHTATARSLVLLDEIGRGTSTYDGVSIAWAVTEHLHTMVGCKTVFATHYLELTQLATQLSAVRNFNVAVREVEDRVLFLHRMEPGAADRSYGIEVGRLAGLPDAVLARAREVLRVLEAEQIVAAPRAATPPAAGPAAGQMGGVDVPTPAADGGAPTAGGSQPAGPATTPPAGPAAHRRPSARRTADDQLALFQSDAAAILDRLARLDTNAMTPLDALSALAALAEQAREGRGRQH